MTKLFFLLAASTPLTEPHGADSLKTAAAWMQGLTLGPLASVLAVIAVAAVGMLMLSGRVPLRRGVTVVLGCFLIFGAPLIAAGVLQNVGAEDGGTRNGPVPPSPLPVDQGLVPVADPYAGATPPR